METARSDVPPAVISVLDNSVLHRVFNLLGPRDLARVSSVCKLWHALTHDQQCDRCVPPLPPASAQPSLYPPSQGPPLPL